RFADYGPNDEPTQDSEPKKREGADTVRGVAGKGADEEPHGTHEHDARRPRITPSAKRTLAIWFAAPHHDERETADGVVEREEERGDGDETLKCTGDDEADGHDGRYERRHRRRSTIGNARRRLPQQAVPAHGEQNPRSQHNDGVQHRRQRNDRQD